MLFNVTYRVIVKPHKLKIEFRLYQKATYNITHLKSGLFLLNWSKENTNEGARLDSEKPVRFQLHTMKDR